MIIYTCPKCGGDLLDIMLMSNPPIPKKVCPACGWSWIGKREETIRVPFPETEEVSTVLNTSNIMIDDDDIMKM